MRYTVTYSGFASSNNPRWRNAARNNGSICGNDVIAMYEVLQRLKKTDTLYLYIKSDGGNGKASLRIVNMLRQYCKRIVALVPLECASSCLAKCSRLVWMTASGDAPRCCRNNRCRWRGPMPSEAARS